MNRNASTWSAIALAALFLALSPLRALAAPAQPHGFPPSVPLLTQAAALTGYFNAGPRTVDTYPANLPFQVLYVPGDAHNNTGGEGQTFHVRPGTMLYVPVMYNDNSLPVIGDFPPAGDRAALAYYIFSQQELGLVDARIGVDGADVTLGIEHVVEVAFAEPLPDGATLYQAVAALMTPLTKGTHTVEIVARATGAALGVPPIDQYCPGGVFEFSTTYTVIVE
jgi:hypothetical protein